MYWTCKYCGRPCLSYILSEKAHVCHTCGDKIREGYELDIDLFWNQKADEEYFNHIGD